MKIFVVLNEPKPKAHFDVYNAFSLLVEKGVISDYKIFSFLHELKNGNTNDEVVTHILDNINEYNPEFILFSHTGGLKFSREQLRRIRNDNPNTVFAYRDGDIYHPFFKPMPKEIIQLLEICHVSFWCGSDFYTKKMFNRQYDVRYVPSVADPMRFSRVLNNDKIYDVVMIGNYVSSKLPFKTMPGSRSRMKLAEYLYNKLGRRFAVFGEGWGNKEYCNGPISFDSQSNIYSKSQMTIAINNLHADYYFSNRFPIALSSGIIILNNNERGLNNLLQMINYPYLFNNMDEAWSLVKKILKKTQNEKEDELYKYMSFSNTKMTMEYALNYMIDVMKCYYKPKIKSQRDITNPWIYYSKFP